MSVRSKFVTQILSLSSSRCESTVQINSTASAAFPLASQPNGAKVTSEDEQEEYEEAEKIRELLESCEYDAKTILSERRTRQHEELLMPIIQKAQVVGAKLSSIKVTDDVIQEGRQLLTELKGILSKIR